MDRITPAQRSKNMSKVKSKNTSLELAVRKRLYAEGFRYRIHYKIKGSPDIVFLKKKIAVFINGCFWHGHGCEKSKLPSTKIDFWENKIMSNIKRDAQTKEWLKSSTWKVITLWECELKKDFDKEIKHLVDQI